MKRWVKVLLVVLVVLALVVSVGPFLVPIPPLEDVRAPEELTDADSRFVELADLSVHYKTRGTGSPTILLLHGFGASLFSWREVIEPLAGFGSVVAYDRPAFGLTERPLPGDWTGDSPYGIEAQVQLVRALLDEVDATRTVLIGHSAGGLIAILAALRYPDRINALVLVSPAVYAQGGVMNWLRPLLHLPQARRLGPLLARSITTRGEDLLELAWHDPSKVTQEIRLGYRRPLLVESWDKALWELTLAHEQIDISGRLGEVTVPVLVVTGDDDQIVPTDQSVTLAQALPDAQLVVIPETGHLAHEEQPGLFMEAVAGFLREYSTDQ